MAIQTSPKITALDEHQITPVSKIFDDEAAELYDEMYLSGKEFTSKTNELITQHLDAAEVKSVLDMSCGTGAQAIALSLAGYNVTATDLSTSMLRLAEKKAKLHNIDISFQQADMRTISIGRYEGIISIFNSIGFLNKEDFAITLRNASENLHSGGIFIFDMFREPSVSKIPPVDFVDFDSTIGERHIKRFSKFVYNKNDENCLIVRRIEIRDPKEENIRVIDECPCFSIYTDDEIERLVKNCGFSDVEIVRQSMLELPTIKNSMNLVIAKK